LLIANPGHPHVVVADYALTTDAGLDLSEPHNAPHVLDLWQFGRKALGRAWQRTTRVALWRPTDKPTTKQAQQRRDAFVRWLIQSGARHLFVLPTPDSTLGGPQTPLRGSQAWQALTPPDALDAMRGARWNRDGLEVTVGYPCARRAKELHRWCNARWLRAMGLPTLLPDPKNLAHEPCELMLKLMGKMAGKPLALDLEFHPGDEIITAVGLSDGTHAVSIPFDSYWPRNNERKEPGLSSYPLGRQVMSALRVLLAFAAPKIAHNFTADVPRLTRRGFEVGGALHDTFAAHAIAFPELRHGLQAAAASMLPIPPWKSLYRPKRLAKGITRDDVEFWVADPRGLRRYNALDAFFTHNLARAVLPHVGVSL
jgi:hypothetical protein